MRHARSVATGEPPLNFNPQKEKNVVLPNTAFNAPKSAGIPLFDGVLNTTVRSHQLKL